MAEGAAAAEERQRLGVDLVKACKRKDWSKAIRLAENGAHVNTKDADQWTPLHWAAGLGNSETAKFLLEKGADPQTKTNLGSTPLMLACTRGHKEVCAVLLEHGADTEVQDMFGKTPLMRACSSGHKEVASHLIEHGAQADVNSLNLAICRIRDVSLAKLLIEKGALASAEPGQTRTIYQAVVDKNWGTAKELLRAVSVEPSLTTWTWDYEIAVRTQGSVVIDVARIIFMGPTSSGKSSFKHLLAYNKPRESNTSTPIMEAPQIVSISSEQYALQESASSWKVVSQQDMAASIRIECRDRKCMSSEERDLPESQPSTLHLEPSRRTSTVAQPFLELHSKAPVPDGDKSREFEGPWVEFEQAHRALLHNLGTGVEERLLQNARFVHLLDTGGQPSFQDVLPLLIRVPCTYVLVFDASQDLDKPLSITYRTADATVKLRAASETGWQMLLRLLSSVYAMKFKSSSMADFMNILGQPPQLRILLVGTFKDRLLVEGRLEETKAKLKKRIESLKKKPYYEHIIRDTNGQPFYLINNLMQLDAIGSSAEDLANLMELRQQLSNSAGSLKLQVPLGWFHFEMITRSVQQKFFKTSELQQFALQLKCVRDASEFRSLLTLFHYLGFFTFFDREDVSDTICTESTSFLKEVSKLLTVQFIESPRSPAVVAFKEEGKLTLSKELSQELGLCKDLDVAWLSRSLCHLGVMSCTSPRRYFMPASLRSEGTQDAVVGTVNPLLVAFTFKVDEFHVTQDLPRGLYCHMAVELANRGWTVTPADSTRQTIKYQLDELDIAITELPGSISVMPILSVHENCDIGKLHDLCCSVWSTVELAFQESAKAVFDDQFTTRADVICGVNCPCDNFSPHLAVPRGSSISCTLNQKRWPCLPGQGVWFSPVEGAELCPHPSNSEVLQLVASTVPQKGEGIGETSQTQASQLLKIYAKTLLDIVNPKLSLVKLEHKGVISPNVATAIECANEEDARYLLFQHLEKNATVDTLREYCKVAIAADGYPRMQELGRKMMESLPLGAPVPHPAPVMTEPHPMAKQRPTEQPSDRQTLSLPFSASQFLKTYEDEFVEVVNAKQSLLKLKHKGVISPNVKASIEGVNEEDANYLLFEHLEKNATVDTLREYCKIAIAAGGYPRMQELGRKMMKTLPPEGK